METQSRLPVGVAAFVGRERERAKVADLVADARVVTLTGPGGCGKTRLAVEVVGDVASRFSDGACWVDLQGVSEPGLVAPAIGGPVDVHERPGQPLTDRLAEQLHARHLLLVLDNCEHLVEACAELVGELSSACPQLHVLATSRVPLVVEGEATFEVAPLPVPNPDAGSASTVAAIPNGCVLNEVSRDPAFPPLCDGAPERAIFASHVPTVSGMGRALDSLIWPQVRYADVGGVSIAYEVRGDGPIDVVRVPGLFGSLFAGLVDPQINELAARMSSFSRLVTIDRRGAGCSDPLVLGQAPPLEQQATDIRAVMDAVGSRRAALVATADGGPPAILFAATFPDRVRALVLRNSWARPFRSDDYPIGRPADDLPELAKQLHDQWGDLDNPWGYHAFGLDRRDEPGFRELFARTQQLSASKAAATAAMLNTDVDVRDLLPLVQAPTLVLHGAAARDDRRRHSQFLVEHISNARLGMYVGADAQTPRYTPEDHSMIEEFLTGTRPPAKTDRVLATVLFTDIVGSTERTAALGDHQWRRQLDAHDAMIRRSLGSFSGREVNTTGDGFLAVFDGPARAIRCAQTIVDYARQAGIDVRAGVHTGECETRGKDLSGIAVHIGSRVASLAGAGEVFTTRTVKDLVAGSGIGFVDRGIHELKGVPEPWHIFQAE